MKSKNYILVMLSILCITILTGCSSNKQNDATPENDTASNGSNTSLTASNINSNLSAEETLNKVLDANKQNDFETVSSHLSNDYFDIIGMSRDEYISSVKKGRFESNIEITDYMIFNQQDIDNNTKRFDVSIKTSTGESQDFVYALTNNSGEWKVLPDGYLSSRDYSYESTSDDNLDIALVKEIDSLTGKTLVLNINNNSSSAYSLGWVSPPNLIVETDKGNYTFTNPSPAKFEIGQSEQPYFDIANAEGEIQKITMTNVNKLNNSGLPVDFSGGYEYVIYQK